MGVSQTSIEQFFSKRKKSERTDQNENQTITAAIDLTESDEEPAVISVSSEDSEISPTVSELGLKVPENLAVPENITIDECRSISIPILSTFNEIENKVQ